MPATDYTPSPYERAKRAVLEAPATATQLDLVQRVCDAIVDAQRETGLACERAAQRSLAEIKEDFCDTLARVTRPHHNRLAELERQRERQADPEDD